MPFKGRISPFLVLLVVAFTLVGIYGFQSLKDHKNASVLLEQRESELGKIETKLKEHVKASQSKDESLKVIEEERDFLKKQMAELQLHSQSTHEELKLTLKRREKELEDINETHRKALEEVEQLKGQLNQKEGEIVAVRAQLQEYAFATARESAEQLTKEKKPIVEGNQDDELKPADEAGIADRSRLQEEDEAQLKKESESFAVEQEMDERSKPTGNEKSVLALALGLGLDTTVTSTNGTKDVQEEKQEPQDKGDTVLKNKDILQDEETDEDALIDGKDGREDNDEKDTLEAGKTSQDEEEHQEMDGDLMHDLRADHEEDASQQIERRLH